MLYSDVIHVFSVLICRPDRRYIWLTNVLQMPSCSLDQSSEPTIDGILQTVPTLILIPIHIPHKPILPQSQYPQRVRISPRNLPLIATSLGQAEWPLKHHHISICCVRRRAETGQGLGTGAVSTGNEVAHVPHGRKLPVERRNPSRHGWARPSLAFVISFRCTSRM